jgi:hypothetical protein
LLVRKTFEQVFHRTVTGFGPLELDNAHKPSSKICEHLQVEDLLKRGVFIEKHDGLAFKRFCPYIANKVKKAMDYYKS